MELTPGDTGCKVKLHYYINTEDNVMNEQLEQALVNIITKATEGIDASVNFLSSEIPDVVGQLLAWKLASNSFTVFISLCTFYLGYRFVKKLIDIPEEGCENFFWDWENHGKVHEPSIVTIALASLLSSANVAALTMFLISIYDILQITIAPKIYLIEYASQLIK